MSFQDPETVTAIAARLVRGHDIRMARLGILRSSWTPSHREGSRLVPPSVDIVLDTKPNLAESEPPTAVDFLSRRIREGFSDAAAVTVDGLGTFETDPSGLVFHADARLRQSVNAELGHLEAHALPEKPEFVAPPPVSPPAAPPVSPQVSEPESEPVSPQVSEPESEPTPPSMPEPIPTPPSMPEPIPIQRPEPGPEWQELASAGETPPRPAPSVRRKPGGSRLDRRKEKSRTPIWLLIAGALIPVLVVVLGVLLWPSASESPPGDAEDSFVETERASPAAGGANPLTALVPDSMNTVAATPTDASPASTATAAEPPNATNAAEELIDEPAATRQLSRGLPGYTLILASGVSEASAENLARSFDDLGLPYGVLTYPSDSGTLNRLALGQWPTVAEADSVRTVLAERLPGGTWVKRLD